jgi:hypothetical protein
MAQPKKKHSRKKTPVHTTAFHAADGDEHVVGIGNLRVMLCNDDGSWFAQGLEIDYFAQGSSVVDVQQRFQNGLKALINFNLEMYGDITRVLRVAPAEVWSEFFSEQPKFRKRHSQVSVHDVGSLLPFGAIDFYGREQQEAMAS